MVEFLIGPVFIADEAALFFAEHGGQANLQGLAEGFDERCPVCFFPQNFFRTVIITGENYWHGVCQRAVEIKNYSANHILILCSDKNEYCYWFEKLI